MQVVQTLDELRAALPGERATAFVPTMGNLHAGHLALVELAKQHGQPVVASIFVNPLQFGANEDFERYPHTQDTDCAKLAAAGCDLVFAPSVSTIYSQPQTFTVQPPRELADDLCGAFRPGHFSAVATIVLKLFNLVQPRVAVFGRKDFQQLFIVRGLVQQFNLPIEIIAGDTLREADGLAMSSRNGYLSPAERIQAITLYRQLQAIKEAMARGENDYVRLAIQAKKYLKMAGWTVDYIEIRDADTLQAAGPTTPHIVALGAAWLGHTRLIDNIEHVRPNLPGLT